MNGSFFHVKKKREKKAAPAYVLGATSAGLAVVRSLGRRGIPVFSLSSPPRPPGHFSRFAQPVLLSDLAASDEPWLDFLLARAEKSGVRPVLIPAGDDEVFFMARRRRILKRAFRFTIPNDEALAVAGDKARLTRFAAGIGLPVPETRFPDGPPGEADLDPGPIGFPCLVKPALSHLWRRRGRPGKLAVARNGSELERLYREMWRPGEPLLIQEIVPGGDDALFGCLSCRDRRGRPIVHVTKRKLRQHPPLFGNGSLQITVRQCAVADLSRRLLDALDYAGVSGIEYKRDERDGSFKILDLNPRVVSGEQMAVDAGADIPRLHYRDALGEEVEPPAPFREGVRYVHLSWDAQAFLARRGDGTLRFSAWIRSLAGVRSFAILSLRDPAPGAVLLGRAARLAASRVAKRVRRRSRGRSADPSPG